MIYSYIWTDSSRLVNIFSTENSVSLHYFTTCSLKRFISCNSDNSVEKIIIIGNMFILWDKHVLNGLLH